MVRVIGQQAQHIVADFGPHAIDAFELVGAGAVDGEEAEIAVGDLDKGIGGFDDIGKHFAFGQRVGDCRFQLGVEMLQGFGLFASTPTTKMPLTMPCASRIG
jgi:hypothetical protein